MRALIIVALLAFGPGAVHAQEEDAASESDEISIAHRPVPEYGRAPEVIDPLEHLLWIPRLLFLPVHIVLEYGVRIPLRWLFRTIEIERLDAPFAQNAPRAEDSSWSFAPRLRYDYGFQPSIGLAFGLRDSANTSTLRATLDFWGTEQIAGYVRGSTGGPRTAIALAGLGSYRTDRIFHGLGWSSASSTRARYAHARGGGELSITTNLWRRSEITAGFRGSVERVEDSSYAQDEDLSIERAIATNVLDAPPGYRNGYTVFSPLLRGVIDTHDEDDGVHSSGVRAELLGEMGLDAEDPSSSWARAGASVELFLEVMRDRTLRLRGLAEIVEPLGEAEVPFTEQIWLGGSLQRMPGFLEGRLIGRSAAVLGLAWRYGIWAWLDAELFVDTGNVFGALFDDFALERLRLDFGTALVTRDPQTFTLLVAFGTEPFVRGADVSSVRFAVAMGSRP